MFLQYNICDFKEKQEIQISLCFNLQVPKKLGKKKAM